jgi:mycofactocin precursor peptide peptidase
VRHLLVPARSRSQRLAYFTWPNVESAPVDALLAVPVGATEQHGPHLPLGADPEIAVSLAQRLSQARPRVLVTRLVAFGSSREQSAFPGTLSIGQEAIELVVVELCRSASVTFPRTLPISAHGGLGDPAGASADEGRGLLRMWIEALVSLVDAWEPRD